MKESSFYTPENKKRREKQRQEKTSVLFDWKAFVQRVARSGFISGYK